MVGETNISNKTDGYSYADYQTIRVIPNKITLNYRKEGMEKFKSPSSFKPYYRKMLFQITEYNNNTEEEAGN